MSPMLHSERPWSMKVVFGSVINEGVRTDRLSNTSVISLENGIFDGEHEMSPFDFDTYACTLMGSEADSIRIGVTIRSKLKQNKESNNSVASSSTVSSCRHVYLNCRTRLINSIETEMIVTSGHARSNENSLLDVVRTQRYTKRYKSIIPKLPMNFRTQNYIPVEQKVK